MFSNNTVLTLPIELKSKWIFIYEGLVPQIPNPIIRAYIVLVYIFTYKEYKFNEKTKG